MRVFHHNFKPMSSIKKRKAEEEEKKEETKWMQMLRLWIPRRVLEYENFTMHGTIKWQGWEGPWLSFLTEQKRLDVWTELVLPKEDTKDFRKQWLPVVLHFFLERHCTRHYGSYEFQILADTSVLRHWCSRDDAVLTAVKAYGKCSQDLEDLLKMHDKLELPFVRICLYPDEESIGMKLRYHSLTGESCRTMIEARAAVQEKKEKE